MDQSVALEAQAMAVPLAHQSSFVSCQGSGYQTPDTGPSSHRSSSGTSSPARASVLSSSSSTGSVDSADAAVVIEPEINIMLCDDVMDYADVQSISEEQEEANTLKATQRLEGVTAVSCDAWDPFLSLLNSTFAKPTTPSTEALSALLTEGFLEPKRISLGLAPSEQSHSGQVANMQTLVPPLAAYATAMAASATNSANLTPNLRRQHRRQSSTNAAVSWNETVSIKHSPLKQHVVNCNLCKWETPINVFVLSFVFRSPRITRNWLRCVRSHCIVVT